MPHLLLKRSIYQPKQVLAFILLFTLFACLGFQNLALNSSYKSFFDADNPLLVAMKQQEATYAKYDNLIIIVGKETEAGPSSIFTPSALQAIEAITQAAWLAPYASRVDSITNYNHSYGLQDELIVSHLFPSFEKDAEESRIPSKDEIAYAKQIIMSTPSLVGNYIAEDASAATIFITFAVSDNPLQESLEISQHFHQLVDELKSSHPELSFHITGTIENAAAFTQATLQDVYSLIPLAYLVMVVLLVGLLRSFWATAITLTLVTFCSVITMGIKSWFNGDINSVNSFAPTMIMTIAVADCIHILVSFLHQYRQGQSKANAMAFALKHNFKAILLTSLTTAIGFACLNFHESPLYRELGNIVALGVLIAFILSLTLLPALIMLVPIKAGNKAIKSQYFMLIMSDWIIRYHKQILFISIPSIVLLIVFTLPKNELNEMFTEYMDDSFSFRQANDYLDERIGGLHRLLYSIEAGKENGIHDKTYLLKLEKFSNWLRTQPEVAFVASYSDVQKRINKAMNNNHESYYRLPENRALAAQYSLLYELSLPYGQGLTNIVSLDKSSTLLVAILYELDSNSMIAFNQRSELWLKNNTPKSMHASGAGLDLMFSTMAAQNIPSMVYGTFFTMLLISGLLLFALRSWSLGFLSILSNIFPALLAFSVWGLLDGRIGIGVAAVATLTLGLVVDDTIHFLQNFKSSRAKGNSLESALRETLTTTGMAMVTITLVFSAGFGLLSFSPYSANADMGIMTAITLLLALFVDLVVLPALIIYLFSPSKTAGSNPELKTIPKPEKGLLGHLPLMTQGQHGCLYDSLLAIKKQQGDIYQLDILNKPWLVVSDHKMIQKILISDREQFPKSGDAVEEMKAIAGDMGILVTEGKQWLRQRQLVMPAFRPEQLKSMMKDMNEISHAAIKQLQQDCHNSQHLAFKLEAKSYLNRIALAIICHVGFDYRIRSFKAGDNNDPLLEAQEVQCKELMKRIQRTKYWKKLPLPSNYRLDKMLSIQRRIFSDIIQQHAEGKAESKILMQQLMTALDDKGQHIGEEELIQLVHSFIAAGHETSGAFLQWTLYYLATHPELQQQVRSEVNSVVGKERDISYEHYKAMPVLEKLLKECLRLRPPIPIMLRSSASDLDLNGYAVKKDSPILLMIGAMQKDEKHWSANGEFFDIANFDAENEAERERFTYAPFGLGPRICVGHRFTMIEASIVIAQLLRKFKFTWPEGQKVEPLLSLVWTTKNPLSFNVERINSNTFMNDKESSNNSAIQANIKPFTEKAVTDNKSSILQEDL